jgi:dTDP-4-dehydrorhamnose 3,5-epimerase
VKVEATALPEVLVLEMPLHADDRGTFAERYHERRFAEHGLPCAWAQDNHARSARGVLRGLHYQQRRPQGKLVSVLRGAILDVAVDVRRGSPTFGRWAAVTLSDRQARSLWIPAGYAHGYCVLTDEADVYYKCTDLYDPADERGVLWSDPSLAIPWPVTAPTLSAKDRALQVLSPSRDDLPEYAP